MPTYPGDIQDKLDALQALTGAQRKPAELVTVYWPTPTGIKIYSSAMYTELPWWPDLAAAIESYFGDPVPLTLTLIPDSSPFIDLPRAASISDDSINLTFDDTDNAFSGLLMLHGEGIRTEVFAYWPAVDLLLSLWRGMLHQPKEMNRDAVKITATSGWRAPQMLVPKRPFATSCPFIFGAFYATQEAIDQAKGCPYNAHLTELERGDAPLIGVPGFTDCPRRVKADCVERLATETFWPGFETREDPIPNNQTQGPNLLAKAIGNESALSDPIRVIFGERYIKACYLLAFRNELNNNHPEDGFGAALFAVSEGPNLAMWEFRMMGELVGAEHFQIRLGALGQSPSDWSPDVNSYSGTAHCYGRIQGEFDNATASDYSGSIRVLGNNEVRVYSNPSTFVEGYTTNRAWCLLHVLAHLRWGYGQDYPRFDIQSWIDAATWCDEYVTLTDSNDNTFSGVRSTFNAEVTARAIQQQVKDICTAGRLGIPFEFEGKDVIVPLKAEDVDDPAIPTFTDEGASRNIIYDGAKSSLSWSVISDETMTNQWTVNFDEAANGGVDTQFIFGDQPQQLRAGRAWGDHSKRVINKSQAGYGINSAQEAARFGNSLLYLGPLDSGGILNPFSVKFTTWYSNAFNVQNYKLIKVVNAKLQSRMSTYFTARDLEPYPDADYTYFRVMKYTRKGDLRVEIEAQQYATLDIVESEPPVIECNPVSWEEATLMESTGSGGIQNTDPTGPPCNTSELLSHRAKSAEAITANDERFEFSVNLDDGGNGIWVGLSPLSNPPRLMKASETCPLYWEWAYDWLDDAGDTTPGNWELGQWGIYYFHFSGESWAVIADSALSGDYAQFQYDSSTVVTLKRLAGSIVIEVDAAQVAEDPHNWTIIGDVARYTYSRPASATDDFIGNSVLPINPTPDAGDEGLEYATTPQAANQPLHLVTMNIGSTFYDVLATRTGIHDAQFCGASGGELTGFGPPRDFIAVVNPKHTGGFGITVVRPLVLVLLSWAPPLLHPELVTGYEMRDAAGALVMATDLVLAFTTTLLPGTYTYKVRATDGAVWSGYATVTFTVPVAPTDLGLIDRDTGNTLTDRISGDVLESRIA
jgi:hypothetical protein